MSRASLVVTTALGALAIAQSLLAAPDLSNRADRKITGEYFRPHTASTYYRSAISHAETLNYYGRRYSHVPAETTKEHTVEIRCNLTAAKKELGKLEKESKGNKQIETHLKAIQTHHEKAEEMCAQLEKESTDGKPIASCCQDIAKELKAADAENASLKKSLGLEEAEASQK